MSGFASHARDRLHQAMPAHRLVEVHRVKRRCVEAGQPSARGFLKDASHQMQGCHDPAPFGTTAEGPLDRRHGLLDRPHGLPAGHATAHDSSWRTLEVGLPFG